MKLKRLVPAVALFLGACGHHYNPPTFLEPKGHERVYAYPYNQPVN